MNANDRLGAMARTLRENAGLTQAALCERAQAKGFNIEQTVYSALERGARNWNAKYIDAVAAGLGQDAAVFLAEPEGPMARLERLAGQVIDELARLVARPAVG